MWKVCQINLLQKTRNTAQTVGGNGVAGQCRHAFINKLLNFFANSHSSHRLVHSHSCIHPERKVIARYPANGFFANHDAVSQQHSSSMICSHHQPIVRIRMAKGSKFEVPSRHSQLRMLTTFMLFCSNIFRRRNRVS